ncbi:MAG TPA: phage BR0599 family protein [Thermomonas sp.]|nr:phage BR0599 family protein [Thermomonas sp.]
MTSEARDASREDGEPIYFYVFMRQSLAWRYTSADRELAYAGNDYASSAITHTGIKSGGDSGGVSISISMPRTLDVVTNWFPWTPADVIMCSIFCQHAGETDALLIWSGRVLQPKWTDTTLTLVSEELITITRGAAPAPRLQRSCWKACYSADCGVDPEVHRVAGTITAIDGFTLTIAAAAGFPDGRLVNGVLEWARPDGLLMSRTIEIHAGSSVTIDYGDTSLEIGLDVSLLPGCRQSWDDCDTYFDNAVNCGELSYIPTRNPHDGNPVR